MPPGLLYCQPPTPLACLNRQYSWLYCTWLAGAIRTNMSGRSSSSRSPVSLRRRRAHPGASRLLLLLLLLRLLLVLLRLLQPPLRLLLSLLLLVLLLARCTPLAAVILLRLLLVVAAPCLLCRSCSMVSGAAPHDCRRRRLPRIFVCVIIHAGGRDGVHQLRHALHAPQRRIQAT